MILMLFSTFNFTVILLTYLFFRLLFFINKSIRCSKKSSEKYTIGILHPENIAGGGGERVLWTLIKSLQEQYSNKIKIIIYSTHTKKFTEVQKIILQQFNIKITTSSKIEFFNIKFFKKIVDYTEKLPFTLLVQSLSSILLGLFSLVYYTPDIFLDTTGYAFTFPVAKIFAGCKVFCYVHYPTISTDMLNKVKNKEKCVNNNDKIAKSSFKTKIKVIYYYLFSYLYGICGFFADGIMVNSTWTKNHIKSLWFGSKNVNIVYPPVCVEYFIEKIKLVPTKRENFIISIGQFRKEKDHFLQINSFNKFLNDHPKYRSDTKLIIIGGCRNEVDFERVRIFKDHVKKLKLEHNVEFHVNASFDLLCEFLSRGIIGLHCMREEHFGICLIEYKAAGLITVGHNSGGPKLDIIVDKKTGFLAQTVEEYAEKFFIILDGLHGNDPEKREEMIEMQKNARERSLMFSESVFITQCKKILKFK